MQGNEAMEKVKVHCCAAGGMHCCRRPNGSRRKDTVLQKDHYSVRNVIITTNTIITGLVAFAADLGHRYKGLYCNANKICKV